MSDNTGLAVFLILGLENLWTLYILHVIQPNVYMLTYFDGSQTSEKRRIILMAKLILFKSSWNTRALTYYDYIEIIIKLNKLQLVC